MLICMFTIVKQGRLRQVSAKLLLILCVGWLVRGRGRGCSRRVDRLIGLLSVVN